MIVDDITGQTMKTAGIRVPLYRGRRFDSSQHMNKDGNIVHTTKFRDVHSIYISISRETKSRAERIAKGMKLLMKSIWFVLGVSFIGWIGIYIYIFNDNESIIRWAGPLALGPAFYVLFINIAAHLFLPPDNWEGIIARRYQKVVRTKERNRDIYIFTTQERFRLK